LAYVEAQKKHNVHQYSKDKRRKIRTIYTVADGDTLWDISRLYNVTVHDITRWNHLSIKKPLRVGAELKILQNTKVILVAVTSAKNAQIKYRVVAGDSLWSISHNYQVSTSNLRKWNKINKRAVLRSGQILGIKAPLIASSTSLNVLKHTVVEGDNLWNLSRLYGVPVSEIAMLNNLNIKKSLKLGNVLVIKKYKFKNKIKLIYKVESGDTLSEISYKFNLQTATVMKWNHLQNAKKLKIGESLTLYVKQVH
jgi:LysM repeat protein